jgi:hypothetical protein
MALFLFARKKANRLRNALVVQVAGEAKRPGEDEVVMVTLRKRDSCSPPKLCALPWSVAQMTFLRLLFQKFAKNGENKAREGYARGQENVKKIANRKSRKVRKLVAFARRMTYEPKWRRLMALAAAEKDGWCYSRLHAFSYRKPFLIAGNCLALPGWTAEGGCPYVG